MEYFNYLGSMIINDARCTLEIKSRIAMAKAAFNKKENLFICKLDANLRKKLLISTFGSQLSVVLKRRQTFRQIGQEYLESVEIWSWIRSEKIS